MRELKYYDDFTATSSKSSLIPTVFTSSLNGAPDSYTITVTFKKKTAISKIIFNGGYIGGGGYMVGYEIKGDDGQRVAMNNLRAQYGAYTLNLTNGGIIGTTLIITVYGSTTNGYYNGYSVRLYGELTQKAIIDIDGNKYGLSGSQLLQLPETSDERALYDKGFEIQSVSAPLVVSSISKVSNKFKLNVIEK